MLSIKKISSVTLIRALSAVLSVVFHLLQVDYFGISREIECYFIAMSLVALFLSLTQVGHLSGHYLPIYHSLEKEHGREAANASFWVVVNWLLIISALSTILSFFIGDLLISLLIPGFDAESKILAARLFQFLICSIVLQLLNIKFNLLLNALNIFTRSELFNLITVVIGLATLFFGYAQLGIWSLVLGVYLGQVATLILNLSLLFKNNITYQWIFSSKSFRHKAFFKNLLFIYPFIFSRRFYLFVLTAAVSFLPQGVYAIYKYVEGIFIRTGGIILTPTTNMFFTNYSIASPTNPEGAKKLIYRAFKINWVVSLFILLVVVSFGNDIVHFFWYNRIDQNQHSLAYLILLTSFISLLFTSIGGLCFKVIFVLRKTKTLYIGRALVNLVLALYAVLSIKFFQETGLISIIIVSTFFSNLLFFLLAYQHDHSILKFFRFSFLAKSLLVFFLCILIGYGINQLNIPIEINGRSSIFFLLSIKIGLLILFLFLLVFISKKKTSSILS